MAEQTFDTFQVNSYNRFAWATAIAVAENPHRAYNPLLVCGPPRCGKTHLLRAVADKVATSHPRLAVSITSARWLRRNIRRALEAGLVKELPTGYDTTDVLLIDAADALLSDALIRPLVFDLLAELALGCCQVMLTARVLSANGRSLMRELPYEWNLVADVLPSRGVRVPLPNQL